jgi:hypothetical protein
LQKSNLKELAEDSRWNLPKFLGFYDPFFGNGVATWIDLQEFQDEPPRNLFRNYQQATFNYSLFYRTVTSVPVKEISPIYTELYMQGDSQHSNGEFPGHRKQIFKATLAGFIGIDGLIMANIAKLLNLKFSNVPVDETGYGGKTKYGNFSGAMGDVIRKKSTIAANARFIKDYFAPDLAFTHPMFFDSFCISK